jgi:hypothetical protein
MVVVAVVAAVGIGSSSAVVVVVAVAASITHQQQQHQTLYPDPNVPAVRHFLVNDEARIPPVLSICYPFIYCGCNTHSSRQRWHSGRT